MRKPFLIFVLAALVSTFAFADGTVTTPQNIAPASWKIASVMEVTGASVDAIPGITIVIYYFDGSSVLVKTDTISLTNAEIASFLTMTNSAIAGENGSQVKRRRMRVSKWLIDNGKISNVTPES